MTASDDPLKWLRACARDPQSPSGLTRDDLAALTGTDSRVLVATAHCWAVFAHSSYDGQAATIMAIRVLIPLMQPHTRHVAKQLIAWALDWSDRDRLWKRVEPRGPG